MIEANGFGSRGDRIVGHVKATRFDIPQEVASLTPIEMAFSNVPLSAFGLGALFNRSRDVENILAKKISKSRPWKVSMECGHKWKDACLLYENEFIPVMDAEIAMRDCIQQSTVKPYKGRKLAVCLGGVDKQVDYWGLALTQAPADEDSDILGFISGGSKELASKKIFYMPMYDFSGSAVEVASRDVDKMIEECASISVIGETCPDCDGGHTHKILSNLQVMPENGHSHYCPSFILKRGSNPSLTGVTDSHTDYPPHSEVSSGKSVTHVHMIDIPLKGKYETPDMDEDESPSISSIFGKDKEMKLEDLLKKLDDVVGKIPASTEAGKETSIPEIASLRQEIANYNREKDIEADRKSYLESLIKDGVVLTKEVAAAAVEEAVKNTKAENEAALKAAEVKNARIQRCMESKIDLGIEFEGIKSEDGTAMTLRKRVEMIPVDEAGDRQFEMDLATWGSNPALLVEEAKTVVKEEAKAEVKAEAASKTAGTRRTISAVGGGPAATEIASTIETPTPEARKIPAHLQGRRAIKK